MYGRGGGGTGGEGRGGRQAGRQEGQLRATKYPEVSSAYRNIRNIEGIMQKGTKGNTHVQLLTREAAVKTSLRIKTYAGSETIHQLKSQAH